MKRRCELRTRYAPPVVRPPSEDFVRVHALTSLAQAHGWAGEDGFMVGMQLCAAGISPVEAVALFRQAEERLQ
jgi:hypothetical protein